MWPSTPTTIRLTWAASTDNVGVVGYNIRRNGRHVASLRDGTTTFVDDQTDIRAQPTRTRSRHSMPQEMSRH